MYVPGTNLAQPFNYETNSERGSEQLRTSQPASSSQVPLRPRLIATSGSTVGASSSAPRAQLENYSILWKRTPTDFVDTQARPLNFEENKILETWSNKIYESRASEYMASLKNSLEVDSQFRIEFFNILERRKDNCYFKADLDAIIDVEKTRLGAAYNTCKLDFQDLYLLGVGLSRVEVFKANDLGLMASTSRAGMNSILLPGIVTLYKNMKMTPPELDGFFNNYQQGKNSVIKNKVEPVLQKRENMGEGTVLRKFLAGWAPLQKYILQASPDLENHLNSLPPNSWEKQSKAYLFAINNLLGPISCTPFEEKLRDSGALTVDNSNVKELAKKMSKALDSGDVNPKWVHALYRWNLAHLAAAAGDSELLLRLVKKGAILDDIDIRRANVAHFAAQGGHESIIEALKNQTQFPIDFNAQTKTGETPLHFAVATQSKTLIEALVGASGEINSKNRVDGCTPLARAAQLGKYKSILSLLNLGADKYIKNNQEQTPLEILKKYHKISTIVGEGKEARKALSLATPLRFDDVLDV